MSMKSVYPRLFKSNRSLLARFYRDQSGNYAIVAAFLMPVLVGTAGLGCEYGLWVYKQHAMLSAADSGAFSAATAGSNIVIEANAVTASYGFVNGVKGTTVAVNQPPLSGNYTNNYSAVEVIVKQEQPRLLTALFGTTPIMVSARAVAIPAVNPVGCVLALDSSGSGAVTMQGSTQVDLSGCALYDNSTSSSAMITGGTLTAQAVEVAGGISGGTSGITTTNGIHTGVSPMADPYAGVSMPSFSGCNQTNFTAQSNITINPGVYCGGMSLTSQAVITMNPGIYFMDQGSLFIRGGATITGSGVTIIFTSSTGSNWAIATIQQNANVILTAPTTGPTAGLIMFGDRNMPTGTSFKLSGGSTQDFGGAVYLPKASVNFTGASNTSTSCTQVIGDSITFTGNSTIQVNCGGYGTKSIGSSTAKLVE